MKRDRTKKKEKVLVDQAPRRAEKAKRALKTQKQRELDALNFQTQQRDTPASAEDVLRFRRTLTGR